MSCSAWPVHSRIGKTIQRRKRERQCEVTKDTKLAKEWTLVQYERYNLILGHHCGCVVRRAAETVLVYSEYIAAYIQGQYNTVWVLGSSRCDSSDPKYASTVFFTFTKAKQSKYKVFQSRIFIFSKPMTQLLCPKYTNKSYIFWAHTT